MSISRKYLPAIIIVSIIGFAGLFLVISNIFPNNIDFVEIHKTTTISVYNERCDSFVHLNDTTDIVFFENVLKNNSSRLRFSDTKSFNTDFFVVTFEDTNSVLHHFELGLTQSGWTLFFDMNLFGTHIKKKGFLYRKAFINNELGRYLSNKFKSDEG